MAKVEQLGVKQAPSVLTIAHINLVARTSHEAMGGSAARLPHSQQHRCVVKAVSSRPAECLARYHMRYKLPGVWSESLAVGMQ